ncbi:MAG: DEAD/DEAH box helicase [Actinobacteria bacterium]|nr:DEAD/DEAH box helicase [Actinomycetota bacterium]
MRHDRAELIAHYAFPLDGFQVRALDALDDGESVLVAAPTGSGKTVVAEYAIDAAVADGKRAFYTAPIKALSNQKYHDLVERLGPQQVGLLTGDNTINGDAPVVVMTTEVLRNMIYARSPGLRDLAAVVLDEVHFLQDTYRGPVWEEVIVHLPQRVRLVCLSATVSNAAELADWISTVRGPTRAVLEDRRPVRLDNLYLIGDKTHDRLHLLPTLVNGRFNHDAARLDEEAVRGRAGKGGRGGRSGRRRLFTPSRLETLEVLERNGMLPAIFFIFSRNQCDEAAKGCLAAGVRLTSGAERERIRELVDARLGAIDPADLAVLGYGQFLAQLEAGVAAHHAGMVPPFKEVVEACFVEGLVKVVFATETLAVGINMPAKSVVIEKLSKFTGDHHTFLTPGEYTQLTGRAGRRGLDDLGHAVVLWSPFVPFDQVATLASSKTFHLNSAFRPTYNMAANLVRSYTSERAHHLLNLSFAQYQADRDVVKIEARLERRQQHLADLLEKSHSPYGDIDDYRRRLKGEEQPRTNGTIGRDDVVTLAMMKLRPGDIIYAEKGRYVGRVAVLTSAHRKGGVRLTGITTRRETLLLTALDFDEPPKAIGKIELPADYAPNRHDFQRDVAHRLETAETKPHSRKQRVYAEDQPLTHPVEDDPELDDRLKAAAQAERVAREVEELRQRMRGRSQSIARDFDKVLGVLQEWGYVDGWSLTDAGETLARTFHECDLLVVECVRQGLLDGVDAPTLAALMSVFVYEHRSPEPPPAPWYPSDMARRRWQSIARISYDLQDMEEREGLSVHRPPDPTFVAVAYAWAAGEGFADVVAEEEMSGGDFVRTMKQLIDLVRQLALVAPNRATRLVAEEAAEALFRGVVAASSAVEVEEADGDDPQG